MEVNLTTQVPLPQSQQNNQGPNATNASGATQTVQNVPDQVVTAATNAEDANVRDDDALRRQERGARETGVASLDDLQIQGLKTRVGFDTDNDLVYLEILTPRTEDVIQRIPSESLVEFLSEQFEQISAQNRAAAQPFDRSI
ncbi:MAG: hypothetical protein RIB45_01555 [Marivibrio sp.]|uniref:hypothetical protein n=1 Tax=Marivibrio sp. TaxID=2039719 RepID=UPI0032EC794C